MEPGRWWRGIFSLLENYVLVLFQLLGSPSHYLLGIQLHVVEACLKKSLPAHERMAGSGLSIHLVTPKAVVKETWAHNRE